jgi:hypothetical protein
MVGGFELAVEELEVEVEVGVGAFESPVVGAVELVVCELDAVEVG